MKPNRGSMQCGWVTQFNVRNISISRYFNLVARFAAVKDILPAAMLPLSGNTAQWRHDSYKIMFQMSFDDFFFEAFACSGELSRKAKTNIIIGKIISIAFAQVTNITASHWQPFILRPRWKNVLQTQSVFLTQNWSKCAQWNYGLVPLKATYL